MCVHTSVQCSFFWYIILFCTSCGIHFARLFHLFLTRADVRHMRVTQSLPAPLWGISCTLSIWCVRVIFWSPLTSLFLYHGFVGFIPVFCWYVERHHWSVRWDISQTVTYMFTTVCIGHRTCAQCVCTVGSCVGAYSSKFRWHAYHTSLLLWWHLFYCHAAYGLFETRFHFVCCLDNNTSSHRASFRDMYFVTHFL